MKEVTNPGDGGRGECGRGRTHWASSLCGVMEPMPGNLVLELKRSVSTDSEQDHRGAAVARSAWQCGGTLHRESGLELRYCELRLEVYHLSANTLRVSSGQGLQLYHNTNSESAVVQAYHANNPLTKTRLLWPAHATLSSAKQQVHREHSTKGGEVAFG